MARSLLQSFVSGTRQMLAVQLFVSVSTVALAGYTAMVTNRAIAERNHLNERVIQLEQALGEADIVPPEAVTIPTEPPTDTLYPPSLDGAATTVTPQETPVEDTNAQEPAQPTTTAPPTRAPADETPTTTTPPASVDESKPETQTTTQTPAFDPGQLLRDLLTPPPPLRSVVLHVRAQSDVDEAQRVARALAANTNMAVTIDIMPPGDARESGYSYFHGRQGSAAAGVVQRLQDAARAAEIAPWVAQLRGAALPANGEYTADRLDIVLPPLPAPRPNLRRPLDRQMQNYQVLPQSDQPPLR
jgi:hypothetical protein